MDTGLMGTSCTGDTLTLHGCASNVIARCLHCDKEEVKGRLIFHIQAVHWSYRVPCLTCPAVIKTKPNSAGSCEVCRA